jgi:hypothetical protein
MPIPDHMQEDAKAPVHDLSSSGTQVVLQCQQNLNFDLLGFVY